MSKEEKEVWLAGGKMTKEEREAWLGKAQPNKEQKKEQVINLDDLEEEEVFYGEEGTNDHKE